MVFDDLDGSISRMTVSVGLRVLPSDLVKVLALNFHNVGIDIFESLSDQHLQAIQANHEDAFLIEEEVLDSRWFIILALSDERVDLLNRVLL
jgi:hypothetical protein